MSSADGVLTPSFFFCCLRAALAADPRPTTSHIIRRLLWNKSDVLYLAVCI
jgi:hypothetical protein